MKQNSISVCLSTNLKERKKNRRKKEKKKNGEQLLHQDKKKKKGERKKKKRKEKKEAVEIKNLYKVQKQNREYLSIIINDCIIKQDQF